MSQFFTNKFPNKTINIASCVPCQVEDGEREEYIDMIVTSSVQFGQESITLYSPKQDTPIFHFNKIDLLKAIQQTPAYGKVDE